MAKLFTFDFPSERIKLNLCYRNEKELDAIAAASPDKAVLPKIKDVYHDMLFPPSPEDRPYVMSSIVLSSDGKMAFSDMPAGPVIAKNNFFDPDGALADFWVLNAMRACCDAIILGARTLQTEVHNTSHIFDPELADQRVELLGKPLHPWNIVVSFDATDIPMDHLIFNIDEDESFPVAIATGPDGAEYLRSRFPKKLVEIGPFSEVSAVTPERGTEEAGKLAALAPGKIPLFITGTGNRPDSAALLKLLRLTGCERLLIESPSYTSHLMGMGMMDEFFINYSMVFAGGTITPNSGGPFSHAEHPHAKLLTMASHRSSFIYTRQKLYYGITQEEDLSKYRY
jgi:riboflavin biosynthesis pyrimidine reductase